MNVTMALSKGLAKPKRQRSTARNKYSNGDAAMILGLQSLVLTTKLSLDLTVDTTCYRQIYSRILNHSKWLLNVSFLTGATLFAPRLCKVRGCWSALTVIHSGQSLSTWPIWARKRSWTIISRQLAHLFSSSIKICGPLNTTTWLLKLS